MPRAGPPSPRGWRLSVARGFARSSRRGRTCWTAVWQAVCGGRGWGLDQGHAVDFMHMSPSLSAVPAASCPVRMCMLEPLRSFYSCWPPSPMGQARRARETRTRCPSSPSTCLGCCAVVGSGCLQVRCCRPHLPYLCAPSPFCSPSQAHVRPARPVAAGQPLPQDPPPVAGFGCGGNLCVCRRPQCGKLPKVSA